MNEKKILDQMLENAQTINDLKKNIDPTFAKRDESPQARQAWSDACKLFHSSYDALAFPGGLHRAYHLLASKDPSIIPDIILYLEANPFYFRSGYFKGHILTYLKAFTFTPDQIKALQKIMLMGIYKPRGFFTPCCKLARKIADDQFKNQLKEIIASPKNNPTAIAVNAQFNKVISKYSTLEEIIIARAQRMLDYTNSK